MRNHFQNLTSSTKAIPKSIVLSKFFCRMTIGRVEERHTPRILFSLIIHKKLLPINFTINIKRYWGQMITLSNISRNIEKTPRNTIYKDKITDNGHTLLDRGNRPLVKAKPFQKFEKKLPFDSIIHFGYVQFEFHPQKLTLLHRVENLRVVMVMSRIFLPGTTPC